jgi:hypothetical protein
MAELLTTKVSKINGRYHCRLIKGKNVVDEMACKLKRDISFCFRYMQRMYDKCGGTSQMASASRLRGKNQQPFGKIWYSSQIPIKESK